MRLARRVTVTNGMKQMRLALPRRPVNEQWVEPHRSALGNRTGSVAGNAVRLADNERVERKFRIKTEARRSGRFVFGHSRRCNWFNAFARRCIGSDFYHSDIG